MIDVTKEKAFEVKDRAFDAAQATKERAQEGTDKTGSFLGEKTEATKQKASETTPSTKESGEAGKENTGGILQQVKSIN